MKHSTQAAATVLKINTFFIQKTHLNNQILLVISVRL